MMARNEETEQGNFVEGTHMKETPPINGILGSSREEQERESEPT